MIYLRDEAKKLTDHSIRRQGADHTSPPTLRSGRVGDTGDTGTTNTGDTGMTIAKRNELNLAADQAAAHGHIEVARWYRVWAATGAPVGDKPAHFERAAIYNGPES